MVAGIIRGVLLKNHISNFYLWVANACHVFSFNSETELAMPGNSDFSFLELRSTWSPGTERAELSLGVYASHSTGF